MRNFLILLGLAVAMAGCATTLPICDGKDRRPINTPDHAEVFHPSCGSVA